MNDWLTALMSLIGTIIGAIISVLITTLVSKQNLKEEHNRYKLRLYVDAINYIKHFKKVVDAERQYESALIKSSLGNDVNEISELIKEDSEMFDNFYYLFALVAFKKAIIKFEELHKEIQREPNKDLSYFANKMTSILREDLLGEKSMPSSFSKQKRQQK